MPQLLGFYHEPNYGENYLSHIFLQEIAFPMELEGGVANDEDELARVAGETFEEWDIVPGSETDPKHANDPQIDALLLKMDREIKMINEGGLPTSDITAPLDELWQKLRQYPSTHRIASVVRGLLATLPGQLATTGSETIDQADDIANQAHKLLEDLGSLRTQSKIE